MSAKIVNVLNEMDQVGSGITDFKSGYYAMKAEVPKGKEYKVKMKKNVGIERLMGEEEEKEKTDAEKKA